MDKINVGIVLNFKNAEKKKDELIAIDSKPWLQLANDNKYTPFVVIKKKKKYVPADVAMGLYIESKYPNIKVDYITPDEISTALFTKKRLDLLILVKS